MSEDRISMRQLMVLLFAALLSPAVRVLPVRTAETAGYPLCPAEKTHSLPTGHP